MISLARWKKDSEMAYNGRLTSLSHGGGCGCKIAPAVLSEILKFSPFVTFAPALLAGSENNEDAAVYQINEDQAIVATTDFFMPIVDDPFDFGRIAASNAISDIYAMGAKPLFALAILGMPINVLPIETIQRITAGGQAVCAAAGIPIAGGHSIDSVEPIYGLIVIGIVDPKKFKRNRTAQAGDSLILSKPIGIGILSAAFKQEKISEKAYAKMVDYTTQLNTPGIKFAQMPEVHALTDVTGFGLAGHLLEMTRGAKLQAQLQFDQIPFIDEALDYVKENIFTGASTRNWQGYSDQITSPDDLFIWQKHLLSDPQTSGGLLIACDPVVEKEVLKTLHQDGFITAQKIGYLTEGSGIVVT
jgi:selenide,water dikinase